jgi:hypothetical protein
MTTSSFECIPIGMPVAEMEAQVGSPYRIVSQEGMQNYYYIERIQTGPNHSAQNTYVLTVKEGVVINKKCSNESKSLNFQVR